MTNTIATVDRCLPAERIETGPSHNVNKMWWAHEYLTKDAPDLTSISTRMSEASYAKFVELHNLLLSIGGNETCFPVVEEDMDKILTRGRFFCGRSKMMVGKPSRCHENACNLWEANRKDRDVHIATGYALSKDGLWRQHSWLVHRYETATQHRTRIIETTVKRLAYFGFEMTEEEALEFCEFNLW